jgi:hypothetical protein
MVRHPELVEGPDACRISTRVTVPPKYRLGRFPAASLRAIQFCPSANTLHLPSFGREKSMQLTQTDFKRQKYGRHQSTVKGREIATDPESIPELLRLTRDEDAATRASAIQCLCPCHVQRYNSEVWDRLFELARDPDLNVRKTIFHILGDGSPNDRVHDVISAMESMFHDPDPKLRRRVRQFLAQYRRTGRVNIL